MSQKLPESLTFWKLKCDYQESIWILSKTQKALDTSDEEEEDDDDNHVSKRNPEKPELLQSETKPAHHYHDNKDTVF